MPSFHMFIVIISALITVFLGFPEICTADYRAHYCSNTTTFTPNSTYQSNLNLLFSDLISNATRDGGFYNSSVGQDPRHDVAYGSFLCRGDLTPGNCQSCVTTAARDVQEQYCPTEKVVVIWYDDCMLRYSNISYFGNMDEIPGFSLWNPQNITDPAGTFAELVGNTMKDVVAAAAAANDKFATREANFSAFQSLYSLAQCTPDLSSLDCNRCLDGAVGLLPTCCTGKQGGRVLYPSCNVRYETYRFYTSTAPPPSTTPALSPAPSASAAIRWEWRNLVNNYNRHMRFNCCRLVVDLNRMLLAKKEGRV